MFMAKYRLIGRPLKQGNIKLVRQDRIDLTPTYNCLSWRETRSESRTNRRFYFEQGAYWRLPILQAREMIREAKQNDFLGNIGNDPGQIPNPPLLIHPSDPNYHAMIRLVTVESPYENEWRNSIAILCTQLCGTWRKVMLLNPTTGYATFRSLTSDNNYQFSGKEASSDGWKLDRAMLDAHPTAFSYWLEHLESI